MFLTSLFKKLAGLVRAAKPAAEPPRNPALSCTFRRAAEADLPRLVKIEKACFPKARYASVRIDKDEFAEYLDDGDYGLIVAETKTGAVAGYILLDIDKEDSRSAGIDSIGVDPAFRRSTAARGLMAEGEDLARRNGFPALSAEVHEHNTGVLRALRRAGFSEIEREADYYDDGGTAVILAKSLTAKDGVFKYTV